MTSVGLWLICNLDKVKDGRRFVIHSLKSAIGYGEVMPFPDAERAIVTQEKICDYLLNPAHPVGGPKAAWFASIGYSVQNWEQLRLDILRVAQSCENFIPKSSPFGVKYETEGDVGCEGYRPATIVAVWIVEENLPPRLVTAYPGNR